MLVRVGPRATGRTTWALEMMQRNPHHKLIVFSMQERERLQHDYPELKDRVEHWNQITKDSHTAWGAESSPLIIDNLDLVLQGLVRSRIDIVTIQGTII